MQELTGLAAVIPAAGLSSRMGELKPLLPLGQSTVLQQTVTSCLRAGIRTVIVVLGHRHQELSRLLAGWSVQIVINPDYRTGMFSSVVAGLNDLPATVAGCFLLPGDVPLVQPTTFALLADAWQSSGASLIRPVCAGRQGHPPLIAARLFPGILAWQQAGGLRACLQHLAADSVMVEVADQGILLDADTPEDYRRLIACLQSRDEPEGCPAG